MDCILLCYSLYAIVWQDTEILPFYGDTFAGLAEKTVTWRGRRMPNMNIDLGTRMRRWWCVKQPFTKTERRHLGLSMLAGT